MNFIHLMTVNSPIFNGELIKIINGYMASKNHCFYLMHFDNYKKVANYENCIFDPNIQSLSSLYEYADRSDFIIIHSLFYSEKDIIDMPENLAKKIVWCVWGHDLYRRNTVLYQTLNIGNILKFLYGKFQNIKNKNYFQVADKKISLFKAIVIGYKNDEQEVRKRFGSEVKVLHALYGSGYFKEDIDKISTTSVKSKYVKIMIGHCSFPFLQHKKYLDKLLKYKDENIKIVLPLSYGDEKYGDRVEAYARKFYGDKVEVYRGFLNSDDYIKVLNDIDIAIFDYTHQAAFGNLILLMYLGVKLYLADKGVMSEGLKNEGIITNNCNDIGNISFSELCKWDNSSKNAREYAKKLLDKEILIKQWESIFSYLERNGSIIK